MDNLCDMFRMEVYEKQINLELLHDVVSFILEATNTAKTKSTINNYLLVDYKQLKSSTVQEKYGFRYLGELLERFEERHGFDAYNIRAIALALAFSYKYLVDDLFVGNQKDNFIQRIEELSKRDIYFKGAMYLIRLNDGTESPIYSEFINATYTKTENLLFVLSLQDDFEATFLLIRKQLYDFLGKSKTIPVIGNEKIYGWLISKLALISNKLRDKEAALFKALAALPVSFVKEDKPHYATLINHGYNREEIVFLNYVLVCLAPISSKVSSSTLVGEKIAVEFFKEYINSGKTHSDGIYQLLKITLNVYSRFPIKCYGCENILEAVEKDISLANSETFCFLYKNVQNKYKSYFHFDILDERWDSLAERITPEEYLSLFDSQLNYNGELKKNEITERVNRFDILSNSSYVASFKKYSYGRSDIFSLLVKKEILNLVDLFTEAINRAGDDIKNNEKATVFIHEFIKGVQSKEAYEFIKYLFENFRLEEIEEHFNGDFRFENELYNGQRSYYGSYRKEIDIERSFLTEEENRQLFYWLDKYMFERKINEYSGFIQCVLDSEFTESLFSKDELRELFNTIMNINPNVLARNMNSYKSKFLPAEELQAEKEKEEQKKLEAKLEAEQALQIKLGEELAVSAVAGFKEIHKAVDAYRYRDKETNLMFELLSGKLDEILAERDYRLSCQDIASLFKLFAGMFRNQKISLAKIQDSIVKIQEVMQCAENN